MYISWLNYHTFASKYSTKENEWVDNKSKNAIQMDDLENQEKIENQEEERLLPECDGLWYMGQSKKHK